MKIELGIANLKLSFSIEARKTTEDKLKDLGVSEVDQFLALCHDGFRDRFRGYLDLDEEAFAELLVQMEQQMPMMDHNMSRGVELRRHPLNVVFEDEVESFGSSAERFIPEEHDIPDSLSHISSLPQIRNQKSRGTCTSFAAVALREFLTGNTDIDLSEQFLYFRCKEIDGLAGSGTYISTAMEVLLNDGVCREETWRYVPVNNNGNEGMGPAPINASTEALNHRINTYHSIDHQNVHALKQAIAGSPVSPGVVVVAGIIVFETSWNRYTELTGRYVMPFPGSIPEGGHAILLCGFQDDNEYPGGGYFIFRNSYGVEWASDSPYGAGYGTIPYEYIRKYNKTAYLSLDLKEYKMDKYKKKERVFHFKKALTPIVDRIHGSEAIILCREEEVHEKYGAKGMVLLGRVSETNDRDGSRFLNLPVYWDMLNHQNLFLCGKTGSGKSHTMSILIEGFLESRTGAGGVIIDPHGEHYSFKYPSENTEMLKEWGISPSGYSNVRVIAPDTESTREDSNVDGTFSIRVADLEADDWINMLKISGKEQRNLVEHLVKCLRGGYTFHDRELDVEEYINGKATGSEVYDDYDVNELLFCLKYEKELHSKEDGYPVSVRRGVSKKLHLALKWKVISKKGTPISDIVKPDVLTVIDIQDPKISEDQRRTIVGILARKIFDKRAESARFDVGLGKKPEDHIPVTYLFIDEMQLLSASGRPDISTQALIRMAKEGRKRGISIISATQQPSAINDAITSQIDGIMAHQLGFEDDVRQFKKRVVADCPKEIDSGFMRRLPRGCAIVGEMRSPARMFVMRIRPRKSLHGGNSQTPIT
jgi:hypothetical protein